jgi:phosphate starvation-inducible PhoH-like protein
MELDLQQNKKITFSDLELVRQLFGEHDCHLKQISQQIGLHIKARGNTVHLQGDAIHVDLAQNLLTQLYGLLKKKYPIYASDIDYAIRLISADDTVQLQSIFLDTVYITSKKHAITPKGKNQKAYIDAMRQCRIVAWQRYMPFGFFLLA